MKKKTIFQTLTIEEVKHLLKLCEAEIKEWTKFKNVCEKKLKEAKTIIKK